jgi:hypothetical protein
MIFYENGGSDRHISLPRSYDLKVCCWRGGKVQGICPCHKMEVPGQRHILATLLCNPQSWSGDSGKEINQCTVVN